MPELRTAGQWRDLIEKDRAEGNESFVTLRVPQCLRDYFTEQAEAEETSMSALLRWAAIDWAIMHSTPNRAARERWLIALWEGHVIGDDLPAETPAHWREKHASLTEQLSKLVRMDYTEWMRRRVSSLQQWLFALSLYAGGDPEVMEEDSRTDALTDTVRRVIAEMKKSGEL